MTRTMAWLVPLLLAGVFAGCSMDTGPSSTESGLTTVRKADYEGQIRYIDDAVSLEPLTAAQLGDTSHAIPVEVRFYDDWAVAWWVRGGETHTGSPDMAIAAWQIVEHTATPTSRDVVSDGDEPTTTEPREPSGDDTLATGADLEAGAEALLPTRDFEQQDRIRELPFARLDWMKDDLERWRTNPPAYHPGCR